uniref:Uncharacterized protein n=1 Tax=Bartonella schoenbuchensis (strain DSM 13525 / NCTC 13165 / R1) TaxID=687861 RepID=E6YYD0_BARSR|nr:hypothetical protein B11C_20218 [Bartonella schoenbuchensis R1]
MQMMLNHVLFQLIQRFISINWTLKNSIKAFFDAEITCKKAFLCIFAVLLLTLNFSEVRLID